MLVNKELVKIKLKSIFRQVKDLDLDKVERKLKKLLSSPYLYLALGVFLGFLFTVQIRTESSRPLTPVLFYDQLNDVKKEYKDKNESLNNLIKQNQDEIKDKENALTDKNLVSKSLFDSINEQELVFGNTDVTGNGIVVTISDGEYQVKDEFSKSLTHAADLRDIVNLLWYAGAEAVSINNERIIYNTSIDCIVSTIMINNNNYVPPFTVEAIGNKTGLMNTLNNSQKLEDIKKRAAKKQINFDIKYQDDIKIERYVGAYSKV